ncbi:conserved putative membrane protein [Candidatus Protochlamydia naegleriophila]|uniref:Conserved putative membrane protein n=1 Tax=Candidatus Protochlamydia naegleriophila TaxID=389348 RepID=A0A0U5JHL0_9BACT|nr:hypothetical protein [Candidatus Protochlamydia naegleriophila]CUI17286.1 conserved putative membrane protein [Candidatus Protochlamydia naegleriophila]
MIDKIYFFMDKETYFTTTDRKGSIMQIIRTCVTLTLFFVLATHSVYGQPSYSQEYEYDDYSNSAYTQSCYSAHWSAYVPIAALLAAGVFWAIADKHHSSHHSSHASSRSGSHHGLGPMEGYSSSDYSSYSYGTGYSH